MGENEPPEVPATALGPGRPLSIDITDGLRAQLEVIAQLNDRSVTEEIRLALESWIETSKSDPKVLQRAETVRTAIEREAQTKAERHRGHLRDERRGTQVGSRLTQDRRSCELGRLSRGSKATHSLPGRSPSFPTLLVRCGMYGNRTGSRPLASRRTVMVGGIVIPTAGEEPLEERDFADVGTTRAPSAAGSRLLTSRRSASASTSMRKGCFNNGRSTRGRHSCGGCTFRRFGSARPSSAMPSLSVCLTEQATRRTCPSSWRLEWWSSARTMESRRATATFGKMRCLRLPSFLRTRSRRQTTVIGDWRRGRLPNAGAIRHRPTRSGDARSGV